MGRLRQQEGLGAQALDCPILTAVRSANVRNMSSGEVDLDRAKWIVPQEDDVEEGSRQRMKAGREHRVPQSPAVLTLLKRQPRIAGSELVFPSVTGNQKQRRRAIRKLLECSSRDLPGERGTCPTTGAAVSDSGSAGAAYDELSHWTDRHRAGVYDHWSHDDKRVRTCKIARPRPEFRFQRRRGPCVAHGRLQPVPWPLLFLALCR